MQRLILHIILIVYPALIFAQDGTFTAAVSGSPVAGEQFEVTFTLSGGNVSGARNFQPPNFGDLVVLSGPNQSTSMQIINGEFSGVVRYSYFLYAREAGKFTIPPAAIELRGTRYTTNPITVEVTRARQQTQQSPQSQQSSGAPDISESLFIRAAVDKQRVKQGEQLTVTYKLYFVGGVSVTGYDISKSPSYEGFWAEDLEQPKQPPVTTEVEDGKQFRVAMIKKVALFPTQSGRLRIPPLEVRTAVQVQSQRRRGTDPFDSFFNDPFFQRFQTVEYNLNSHPISITVDALPSNPPTSFAGAVGKFSIQASVDKKEVLAGDPITLRLTLSGTGNVKLLTIPRPVLPADMEAYEPKISEEITREGGIVRGKKTADYLIVARNAGQRVIESIPFTSFDLSKNSYVTERTPRFDLTIKPGRELAGGGVALSGKSDVRLLGEDIRFLKLSLGSVRRMTDDDGAGSWFVLVLLLPPFVFVGSLVYRKRMENVYGDMPRLRSRKAAREASKRLKNARKVLASGDTQTYHAEVSKALFDYLRDKLQIPPASLTMEEAVTRLHHRGVTHEVIAQLQACIERAEFARFAPANDTQEARHEFLKEASNVLTMLEKNLSDKA